MDNRFVHLVMQKQPGNGVKGKRSRSGDGEKAGQPTKKKCVRSKLAK